MVDTVMKKTRLVLVILFLSMAGTGQETKLLDQISRNLPEYGDAFSFDQIRIFTDKEIYAPGEILWFSGYVADRSENQLTQKIPEISVNLYDAAGKMILGDRFPVTDGMVRGDLLLPAELPLGRYYLAAYTPLLANPGHAFSLPLVVDRFYESDATVSLAQPDKVYKPGGQENIELKIADFSGSPVDKFLLHYEIRHGSKILDAGKVRSSGGKAVIGMRMPEKTGRVPLELMVSHPRNLWTKKFALRHGADEIQVTFFPEGGNVISGVPQKIGYYATIWENVPVDLEGDILNSSGEIVSRTKSFIPGFGIFPCQSMPGEQFRLVVTGDYGKGQTFSIPAAEGGRYALTVPKTDGEFITADILTDNHNQQKMAITATRGTLLLWAAEAEVSPVTRIRIPVREVGPGIVLLSLFDEAGKAASSRLIALPAAKTPEIEVTAALQEEGKVKITVSSRDENGHPFPARVILTVADQRRYTHKEGTLENSLNFQGVLENLPLGNPPTGGSALDFMLLSNRLVGFDWEKIVHFREGVSGEVPLNSFGIGGIVTDRKGVPVPGARVSLMDTRNMQLYSATAGQDGRFHIPSVQINDMHDFRISATSGNGRGNLQVNTDPTFADKVGEEIRKLDFRFISMEAPRHNIAGYLASNPDLLAEQPSVKPLAAGNKTQRDESYKNLLQTATNLMDVIKAMKPFTLINGQIVFPGTVNSINAQSGALIVLDGQKLGTQADVLNSISPFDVDKINISLDPMDIQRYTGFNNVGIIEITTLKGSFKAPDSPLAVTNESLYNDGLRIPRNFLTADAVRGQKGKDLRTTLYWDPDLETGPRGMAAFSIPLSEISSGFVIRIHGIFAGDQAMGVSSVFEVKHP